MNIVIISKVYKLVTQIYNNNMVVIDNYKNKMEKHNL